MGRRQLPRRRLRDIRLGCVRRRGGSRLTDVRDARHRLRRGAGSREGAARSAGAGTGAGRRGAGDRVGAARGVPLEGWRDGQRPAHELPDSDERRPASDPGGLPRDPVCVRRAGCERAGGAADGRAGARDPQRGGRRDGSGPVRDPADAGTIDGEHRKRGARSVERGVEAGGSMNSSVLRTPHSALTISFSLNGSPISVDVDPADRLLDTLRYRLGLTGTKEGCGEGECGACTVYLDGLPVDSCPDPTYQVQGARVETVESLAPRRLDPLLAQGA